MSVPSKKKQSGTREEDGQQGAIPGSYYHYSPHSAAPGSERAWQENYHQMARRVTGGPSSWGQYQQPSQSHPTYGQQQYQYSVFQSSNGNNATAAADPWNWGWDETNNTESGNNNPQPDPTWDWSVEGSNNYQQQAPPPPASAASNIPVNYIPENQQPQTWHSQLPGYGNEGHQQNFNNVPHTIQNIVDDSFSTLTTTNQNNFNQQPVVFQTVNRSGQNLCSFGTGDNQGMHLTSNNNSIAEHSTLQQVPAINENSNNTVNEHLQSYGNSYFSGFPVGNNQISFHSQSVEYEHQDSDTFPQEQIETELSSTEINSDDRILDATRNSESPSIQKSNRSTELLNIKQETEVSEGSFDLQTNAVNAVEDALSAPVDCKRESSPGHEACRMKWPNESSASHISEGYDEVIENSSEFKNSQESSYPHSYHHSSDADQVTDISGQSQEISRNVCEQESALSYTANFSNVVDSEVMKMKQESISTPSPDQISDFRSSPGSAAGLMSNASENKSSVSEHLGASGGMLSQQVVDDVMKNLQSLSLGNTSNNASDVENAEIVPPENNPPLGNLPLPPPPVATSLVAGSSSNPYAARNSSLQRKYGNKHHIPPQPTVSLAQSESDHKKINPHFVLPNEMFSSGNYSARNKTVVLPTTEEAVNLETVPDNKERPDFVDIQHSLHMDRKSVSPISGSRPHAMLGQDSARGPTIPWNQQQQQQPLYSRTPENQEIAPRCGPERNQYLETGQLPDDDLEVHGHIADAGDTMQYRSQPFLPPPGLHRMVPGQRTEKENVPRSFQSENGIHEDISTPPPGLHRMVPGQFTESGTNGVIDISNSSHQNDNTDDLILHRMVPGRLMEDIGIGNTVQNDTNSINVPAGSTVDEIPPPGLRRMVPGESSSPESQGNSSTTLISGNTAPGGTFQPIDAVPMEPRVVTGVAQDEIDISGNPGSSIQTPSPVQLSSSGRVTSEADTPSPEESLTTSTLPQPPSERSETIGSDRVETYPPAPTDGNSRELSGRRDTNSKERDRRHREDQENDDGSRRRQTNGREYYGPREREESPNGGRYRGEDRERRPFDRERNHDREDSPSNGRYRYDSRQEYRHKRAYEEEPRSRHRRGYDRSDEDADTEDYYNERDRDRKLDRERDRGHERDRREGGYRDDYEHHYRSHPDRDRSQREGLEKPSRDRPDHRSRARHERDRDDRDRDGYRDRKRYDYRDWDYRRMENYYGREYDDDPYYRSQQRSRPDSRSGRPEYEDDRRRDYHNYGAGSEYFAPNYQMYFQYLAHVQHSHWQYLNQQGSYRPEDRGSVHSGRSSANEELHRDRSLNHGSDHNTSMVDGITTLPQRMTPAKFTTAHVKGVLSAHGQLLKTPAHYPLDGQPAVVELFDLQNIFWDDETYNELKDFPGPLIKSQTHKKSVIAFCLRKIEKAERDPTLVDRDSVILFWQLLILLLKQNGTVVGSDIAELLLNSSNAESSKSQQSVPSPAVSHGSINEINHDDHQTHNKTEDEITTRYRDFLLYGNTKEALEWAMKHGLWGHALFLASKMDQRTYANVMMRFANGLTMNDPLQTLYQMMSNRQPAAVTCCADEKWGDWKPHLAMIVSNSNQWEDLHRQAIATLGDTLASRGCLHAAHFCYVMAQLDFGTYSQKSSKIVLLGSSHLQPFSKFANNEAIQITEIYLYTIQLANSNFEAPHFQPYKLLYAQRLAEYGMVQEALQYAEEITRAVLKQPACYDLNFLQRLYDLGNQLKYHDPIFNAGEGEDASWLQRLAASIDACVTGTLPQGGPSYGSTSNLSYSEGDSLQPQYQGMDYISNNQESHYYDNSWQQQQPYQDMQQWQQQQPGTTVRAEGYNQELDSIPEQEQTYISHPEPVSDIVNQDHQQQLQNQQEVDEFHSASVGDSLAISNGQYHNTAFDYQTMSANKQQEGGPKISLTGSIPLDEPGGPQPLTQHPPPSSEDKQSSKPKLKKESSKSATSSSWFGGIWNKLALRPKNQMILPDDKNPSIVWDPDKKRWTNVDSDEDETIAAPPPPPKVTQLPGANDTTPGLGPSNAGDAGANIYKMNRGRGSRGNYVDVLGGNTVNNPVLSSPAMFQSPTTTSTPMNLFVPEPVEIKESNPDFLRSAPAALEPSDQVSGESSQNPGADIGVQPQPTFGGPLMFNPTSFSQPLSAAKNTGALGRKRYPQ